jgi:hypothetical protein
MLKLAKSLNATTAAVFCRAERLQTATANGMASESYWLWCLQRLFMLGPAATTAHHNHFT